MYRRVFYKTVILLGLAGYEMIYNQLGTTRLVGFTSFHIQRALIEIIVNYYIQFFQFIRSSF